MQRRDWLIRAGAVVASALVGLVSPSRGVAAPAREGSTTEGWFSDRMFAGLDDRGRPTFEDVRCRLRWRKPIAVDARGDVRVSLERYEVEAADGKRGTLWRTVTSSPGPGNHRVHGSSLSFEADPCQLIRAT